MFYIGDGGVEGGCVLLSTTPLEPLLHLELTPTLTLTTPPTHLHCTAVNYEEAIVDATAMNLVKNPAQVGCRWCCRWLAGCRCW